MKKHLISLVIIFVSLCGCTWKPTTPTMFYFEIGDTITASNNDSITVMNVINSNDTILIVADVKYNSLEVATNSYNYNQYYLFNLELTSKVNEIVFENKSYCGNLVFVFELNKNPVENYLLFNFCINRKSLETSFLFYIY